MTKSTSYWLLGSLYLFGFLACIYLLTISFGSTGAVCLLAGSDCASAVSSKFGKIAEFPASSFGIAYYIHQIFLLILSSLKQHNTLDGKVQYYSFGFNLVAVAFSLYFLYLLTFILDDNCIACLTVHSINISTLIIHIFLFKGRKKHLLKQTKKPHKNEAITIINYAIIISLIAFLVINLAESRYLLREERQKISENLLYYLFKYDHNEKFVFTREPSDKVHGNPDQAIHQVVLVYKEGCRHCQIAEIKLIKMVEEYSSAIYLLSKNYKTIGKDRLKELQIEHAPAIFINGRRADGWEMPGFMENFTENCGC